jgi:DNA polymerase-3 subunit alpha (Gram-positive type)
MEYSVVDIETTGLSKYVNKITELAAVKVVNGEITKEYQTLVNPQEHIPSFITKLTGISDDMVQDAPTIEEALPKFLRFMGDRQMVAHNATFDHGFIHENAKQQRLHFLNEKLCTRKLANRLVPTLPNKKLGTCCQHFSIVNTQAHRAMSDVHATHQLFLKFQDLLKERGVDTPEMIARFEKMPRR